ncbi:MAG TPA: nucleotide exchange factor GrpE [Actinomycetota bacterium]|nr:nucleotide exchange factor GrpE [Actinomycetota bacterium]
MSSPVDPDRPRVPVTVRDKRAPRDESEAPAGPPRDLNVEPQEPQEQADPRSGLEAQLEEVRRLSEDRLEQLRRDRADYENFKQRLVREQSEAGERASRRIIERLLPVLDDFDRAVEAAGAHEGAAPIVRGVELAVRSLRDLLKSEGLEHVEAEGQPFDPQLHEAMSSVRQEDVSEPTVLGVIRPGYSLKGRTIRPALVHVAVPSEGSESAAEPAPEEGA